MFKTDFSTWVMLTELSTKKAPDGPFAFENGVFPSEHMHSVSLGYWGPFHERIYNMWIGANILFQIDQFASTVSSCMLMHVLEVLCFF